MKEGKSFAFFKKKIVIALRTFSLWLWFGGHLISVWWCEFGSIRVRVGFVSMCEF
jgi:hypothetical protein